MYLIQWWTGNQLQRKQLRLEDSEISVEFECALCFVKLWRSNLVLFVMLIILLCLCFFIFGMVGLSSGREN